VRCQKADPLVLFAGVLASCALLAAVGIVGAVGREDATRSELASLSAADRALHAQVVFDPAVNDDDRAEARAAAELARLRSMTEPLARVRVWGPVEPADERGTRLVAISGARPQITSGRAAEGGCERSRCEVLSLGPRPRVGSAMQLQGVRLVVVGRARLPAAIRPDGGVLRGRALIIPGAAPALGPLLSGSRRFSVLTAPLAGRAVHGSRLGRTADDIDAALTRIHQRNQPSTVRGPGAELRRLDDRITTAQRRLLVIGIEGAALLIAFAAFFATTRRDEVALSTAQLAGLGASRRQLAAWRVIESAGPALAALLVALPAAIAAAALYARGRGPTGAFVGSALPFALVASMVLVAVAACAIVIAWGRRPARDSSRAGALEVGACVALAVIVWQAASTGGLDPDTLAEKSATVPVILFVPALAVLAGGVLLLRLLPLGFRGVERLARRGPLPVRLGLLGTVRHPRLAGAATTFLAVALGSALFALNYRSTLVADAHAGARFAAGASWRVTERGARPPATASVAPLTRYRRITREQPTPVLRLSAALDATGASTAADIQVLGIPGERLREIKGWRADFSDASLAAVGRTLARERRPLRGPRLDPSATAIRMWARSPSANAVLLRVVAPGQAFAEIPVGSAGPAWHHLRAPVPRRARGGILASIGLASEAFGPARSADFGVVEQRLGDGRWTGLTDLHAWAGPVGGIGGASVTPQGFPDSPVGRGVGVVFDPAAAPLIRAPYPVPAALPAIAGPDVGTGRVDLHVIGVRTPLRVVASSSLFPSVTHLPRRFVVVDYATLFAYLNGAQPGIAEPSEAWFFGRPPPRERALLEHPPFRAASVTDLRALDRSAANDVLALNARHLLTVLAVVAALLGLAGFLVALRAIARDERQELAEYEAMGVDPAQLGSALRIRLAAMASVGIVAAVAGGIAGNALTAGLVAVSGAGRHPLPPIEARVAWLACAVLLVAVSAAVAALTWGPGRPSSVPVARRLREG
jgi:hypothetical protein